MSFRFLEAKCSVSVVEAFIFMKLFCHSNHSQYAQITLQVQLNSLKSTVDSQNYCVLDFYRTKPDCFEIPAELITITILNDFAKIKEFVALSPSIILTHKKN